MEQLIGVHHVTAITSSAEKIYDFFTHTLGMRLVKKTVNQDDIQAYHLFFADDRGTAGTDMTFFDFSGISKGIHGANEIAKTSFRVPSDAALAYWEKRFAEMSVENQGVTTQFGKKCLSFVDFDGQRYQLISDENNQGVPPGTAWQNGPIPHEFAINGLGPVFICMMNIEPIKKLLQEVLLFRYTASEGNFHLFETGEGGNGGAVILEQAVNLPQARQGFGTVHHAAFRVADRAMLDEWMERLNDFGIPNSGHVDRYFFESLYARVSPFILFEFATDGPGFMGDEPYETLGEKLSLPPFLEERREAIEKHVRHIDTRRSDKVYRRD